MKPDGSTLVLPLRVFFPVAQKPERKWPKLSKQSKLHHHLWSFWRKEKGRGVVATPKILNLHFKKYSHVIRRGYVKIRMFLLYKSKNPVIFWYLDPFSEILTFGLCFTENRLFGARPLLWRHCDVILEMLGTYLGINEKRRPLAILWYQFGVFGDHFQAHSNPPNLIRRVTKKGLVRLGLTANNWQNWKKK